MTAREELHKLVDALAEPELRQVRQFIEDLRVQANDAEPLSAETLAAIREGLEDIERGNTMTVEEYRRTRGL